jgi:FkbM family methyltransferase
MLGPLRPTILELLPVVRRFSIPIPHTNRSVVFKPDGDDESVRYFWHGFKFEEAVPLIARLAKDVSTFIDVGANIGLFSLVAAIANPTLSVFALEPVPTIRTRLDRYISLNRLTNVSVHELALGEREGIVPIYVQHSQSLPTDSSLLAEHRPDQNESIDIRVTTLDAFVAANSIKKVDLLKIDTEGTERDVLEGGIATIESDRPTVLCELLPERPPTAAEFLLNHGYFAFHVTPDGLVHRADPHGAMGPQFSLLNWLFVHEEKLPWLITRLNFKP